ncbi:PilZ domain-containing protein [bacterium]|nr:PilZ domain-containing protein [bacterium]
MAKRNRPFLKTVPLSTISPYQQGMRFLVLPALASLDASVCRAVVSSLESNGAWLELLDPAQPFPLQEEIFLVQFRDRFVLTHRTRILNRKGSAVWVDCPSISEQEESRLAPFRGRQDFRVEADLSVMILLKDPQFAKVMPRSGQLSDLSRGGMGLIVPVNDIYAQGQRVEVQVVSWAYPVSVETTVNRVWIDGDIKRLALAFPESMTVEQRELVSSFIIHVQRRDALQSSLPVSIDEAT